LNRQGRGASDANNLVTFNAVRLQPILRFVLIRFFAAFRFRKIVPNLSAALEEKGYVISAAAIASLLLWFLGMLTGHTMSMGGFIHAFLVTGIELGLFSLVRSDAEDCDACRVVASSSDLAAIAPIIRIVGVMRVYMFTTLGLGVAKPQVVFQTFDLWGLKAPVRCLAVDWVTNDV